MSSDIPGKKGKQKHVQEEQVLAYIILVHK